MKTALLRESTASISASGQRNKRKTTLGEHIVNHTCCLFSCQTMTTLAFTSDVSFSFTTRTLNVRVSAIWMWTAPLSKGSSTMCRCKHILFAFLDAQLMCLFEVCSVRGSSGEGCLPTTSWIGTSCIDIPIGIMRSLQVLFPRSLGLEPLSISTALRTLTPNPVMLSLVVTAP